MVRPRSHIHSRYRVLLALFDLQWHICSARPSAPKKLIFIPGPPTKRASKRRQIVAAAGRLVSSGPIGMRAEGAAQGDCAGPSDLNLFSLSLPRPYGRDCSLPALCASLLCSAIIKDPYLSAKDLRASSIVRFQERLTLLG